MGFRPFRKLPPTDHLHFTIFALKNQEINSNSQRKDLWCRNRMLFAVLFEGQRIPAYIILVTSIAAIPHLIQNDNGRRGSKPRLFWCTHSLSLLDSVPQFPKSKKRLNFLGLVLFNRETKGPNPSEEVPRDPQGTVYPNPFLGVIWLWLKKRGAW